MSVVSSCINGVCYGLLPGEKNDYRPLALRHGPLAVVSALLITVKILAIGLIALTPATAELSTITESRIIELTNTERKKAGLSALSQNSQLTAAAKDKGENMLAEDYFAHISPTGVTPWFWLNKYDYGYQVAGENLAIDFIEAEDVVAAWLASPTHKENMLFPTYTETGVAVVSGEFQGGTSIIVVHMFGLPAGQTAPAKATSSTKKAAPAPNPVPAEPTPIPLPPSDTTSPVTPRIALLNDEAIVQTEAALEITGEEYSSVSILINNQILASFALPANGQTTYDLDLSSQKDGQLVLRSYATDKSQNQSELSPPILLVKDTTKPDITPEGINLLLSPATDQPELLVTIDSDQAGIARISVDGEATEKEVGRSFVIPIVTDLLTISLVDAAGNASEAQEVNIVPKFAPTEIVVTDSPAKFIRSSRWLNLGISIIVFLLLLAAIIMHIRIQRPGLIAHSSLVVVLAIIFFLF